jgi:hypothetical protein
MQVQNMIYDATNPDAVKIAERMSHIIKRPMDQENYLPTRRWKNLFPGKRGTVAVLVALCAPVLLVTVGLGIEASGWTAVTQRLQRTADVAALAGAQAYNAGASVSIAATEAAYVAEINGATGVSSTTTPTTRVWNPNTSPPYLADNMVTIQVTAGIKNSSDKAFVAKIKETIPLLFSHYYLRGPTITLNATATAENVAPAEYCVLALDPGTATGATTAGIDLSNGAVVDLSQCGIDVNAAGSYALDLTGGVTLTATSVSVVGAYSVSNSTMNVSGTTTTGAAPGVNPYAGVNLPTPGTPCLSPNVSGNISISGGTYCSGLNIAWGTITMNPGVYIISGGQFSPQGGSTVDGTGVTIVLTGSGSSIATANIANGVTLNITAPTTGTLQGLAIVQSAVTAGNTIGPSTVAGGANMNVTGAMVFPSSVVSFSNGANNSATCTQLIAYQVQFSGASKFSNNCAGTGTSIIGTAGGVSLVE